MARLPNKPKSRSGNTPMESDPTSEVSKDRQVNAGGAPPGNKNALKHGLHAFKAMLDGDGLDQRSSLFRALRAKESELTGRACPPAKMQAGLTVNAISNRAWRIDD